MLITTLMQKHKRFKVRSQDQGCIRWTKFNSSSCLVNEETNQDVPEDTDVCMQTHLAAMVLYEDLRHVDDSAQGLNALPFPTTHRLGQNLKL